MLNKTNILLATLIYCLESDLCIAQDVHLVTRDYPPFSMSVDDIPRGLAVEMTVMTLKEAGLSYDIAHHPGPRARRTAETKPNIIITPLLRTTIREKDFLWTKPMGEIEVHFFKLASREDIQLESLDMLSKYSVSVVQRSGDHELLVKRGHNKFTTVTDVGQSILQLDRNYVDLIMLPDLTFMYFIRALDLDVNKFERLLKVEELSQHYYAAFSLETPNAVVARYNNAIETLHSKKLFQEIRNKYSKNTYLKNSPTSHKKQK